MPEYSHGYGNIDIINLSRIYLLRAGTNNYNRMFNNRILFSSSLVVLTLIVSLYYNINNYNPIASGSLENPNSRDLDNFNGQFNSDPNRQIQNTESASLNSNRNDQITGRDFGAQQLANNDEIINPVCGQVVQGNVRLSSNLVCNSDGLIVGASGTQIDLNGYSIKGPGPNSNKVGIMVGGQNNVAIFGNGIISGFQSGIYISGSDSIVSEGINFNNNKVAVYITGAKFSSINNNMMSNNSIGVASHSSNLTSIKYNLVNQNKLSGITFINTVNSVIDGNNVLNTSNGIFLDTQSSQNRINFNNVFNNILDINNANNLPININNNHFSNNNCIVSLPSGLCIGR
ncbi:MAG: right-handed parallel beta-helix repeat-containing protein [Thermoproteota archaeon]|nr:right-handed parallel beta-helix repeat-containing protein [Thermoproteota archaeon]